MSKKTGKNVDQFKHTNEEVKNRNTDNSLSSHKELRFEDNDYFQ